MSKALYRRYRPETFAGMIGQAQVTEPLMTALRSDRIGHAYLFSGPRGCGKTTSARILASCLNCAEGPTDTPCGSCASCVELSRAGGGSLDVVEIDAASHNGVDDARDLRERAIFAPARDRFKIFILDEAHMVTAQGFNALLKLVEEPPEHVKFIFATTEPDKVIGTIRSRTHHYPFRLVPPAAMLEYVEQLCEQEGVQPDPGVLPLVVRAGAGSPRDTLSILDQLIAGSEGDTVGYERAVALLGYTHGALLDEVVGAFAASDAASAFAAVDRVVQTGQDPRRFVDDLLERLRDLIVIAATGDQAAAVLRGLPADELERMQGQAREYGAARLSRTADVVSAALDQMTGATSPRLQLELMIARVLTEDGAGAHAPEASSGAAPSASSPGAAVRGSVEPAPSPSAHGAPAPATGASAPQTASPAAPPASPGSPSVESAVVSPVAPAASGSAGTAEAGQIASPAPPPAAPAASPGSPPAASPAAPPVPPAAPSGEAPVAPPSASSAEGRRPTPGSAAPPAATEGDSARSDERLDEQGTAGPVMPSEPDGGEPAVSGGARASVDAESTVPPVAAPAGPPESDEVPAAAWSAVAPGQAGSSGMPPADEEPPADDVPAPREEAMRGEDTGTSVPGTATEDAPQPAEGLTLDSLRAAWPRVLAAIEGSNRASWLVLQSAAPAHVADDVVGLAFTNQADLGRFKTRAPDGSGVSEDLRTAILETLGQRVKFLAKHIPNDPDGGGGSPGPHGPGPSEPAPSGQGAAPAPSGRPSEPVTGAVAGAAPSGASAPASSAGPVPDGDARPADGAAPDADDGEPEATARRAASDAVPGGLDDGREGTHASVGGDIAAPADARAATPSTQSDGSARSAGAAPPESPSPDDVLAAPGGPRADAPPAGSGAPVAPSSAAAPAPSGRSGPETSAYAAAPASGWAVAPIPNADAVPPAAAAPPPFAGPTALAVDADPGEATVPSAPAPRRDGDVIDDVPPEPDDDAYPPEEAPVPSTPTVQARQVQLDDGVQRYGEAVVRQKLGARFLREEEFTPPTRFQ
ncbi:DNA polymerase III subunit gamma and tau [Microbacterium suaedae]|uniref:DNA polymerase III subunit gamma and tau n=1 Tax=Microbacterium suaedae TaxID=2067813 RepID=UPI000DA21A9E|nr:DNA polymerase III subunit gamma and tau [Microbacterium suaedae]